MNAPTDQRVVEAKVESVLFRDGVKVVLSLVNGSGARALAAQVGYTVQISLAGAAPVRDEAQGALALTEPWRAPTEPGEALRTAIEHTDLPSGEDLQRAFEATVKAEFTSTEPYVAERDGAFIIAVGKDETQYPGAPASFKTALRAETWLQQHLAEKEGDLVRDALDAFRAAGLAEGKRPEDERNWDGAFERASAQFTPAFIDENYAELSAAFAEGFDKALD